MNRRFGDLGRVSAFVAASIASGLVGFAFLPALTRALPSAEFAAFSKVLLYVQMLSAPMLFGFPAYITTHVERLSESHDLISSAASDWTLLVIGASVILMLLGGASGYLFPVTLLLMLTYIRTSQTFAAQAYRLLVMPGWFVLYQVTVPVAFYLIAIAVAKLSNAGGALVFCAASVVYLVAAVHTWFEYRSRGWIGRLVLGRFSNPGYVRFAAGAFLHSLAGVAVTSWDKAYVASRLDAHSFAAYSVGAQYAAGLVLIYSSINQALIPQLYAVLGKQGSELHGYVRFLIRITGLFVGVLVGFELLIDPVIRLMLPPEFHKAVGIARELGLAATLQGVYFVSSSILFYYHRTLSLSAVTMAFGGIGWLCALASAAESGEAVAGISALVWALFSLAVLALSLFLVVRNAKKSS